MLPEKKILLSSSGGFMTKNESDRISFTRLYTSYVWRKHGLNSDSNSSSKEKLVYWLCSPIFFVLKLCFKLDMEAYLLQRHLVIDSLVADLIAKYGKINLVEIGCGNSPRSLRLLEKYGNEKINCIDMDLPAVILNKSQNSKPMKGYSLKPCDILKKSGKYSLEESFSDIP